MATQPCLLYVLHNEYYHQSYITHTLTFFNNLIMCIQIILVYQDDDDKINLFMFFWGIMKLMIK